MGEIERKLLGHFGVAGRKSSVRLIAVPLQECKQRKDFTNGKRIHAQMVVLL
jgi:hypothetical protein